MTPMMTQYLEIKKQHQDAILFFRLGDFYEMFFDDAHEASRLLNITLTARSKGDDAVPMCGVPYHAADTYIAKLTKLGKKVAICEQLSDPSLPGIVKRDVIRIITPGTTMDDSVLDQKMNNYVLGIFWDDREHAQPGGKPADPFHLAYADLTTGEFKTTGVNSQKDLIAEIQRISPREIIHGPSFPNAVLDTLKRSFPSIFFFSHGVLGMTAQSLLTDWFSVTQKTSLDHMEQPEPYEIREFMPLDEATLKNLELLTTLRENAKEGSLLWVLDRTRTSMGGRMLRHFVTHPLLSKKTIDLRLDAVQELTRHQRLMEDICEALKPVMDLERLISRLSMGRGNARDLVGVRQSLTAIPQVIKILGGVSSELLAGVRDTIDPLSDVTALIAKAILPDPPISISDGGIIADGFHEELDQLKRISRDGKNFIRELQQKEAGATGISNLKVRYNRVFGYYLEVSKSHVGKVPSHYIRKQTLVNAERYITPELKDFEEKVLSAEEKIVALEQKIFQEVRAGVVNKMDRIKVTAKKLALLDVLVSFASVAVSMRYCRPEITEQADIRIVNGRHPVVESMNINAAFVPNDAVLTQNGERVLLITGPNMGGKSTYLRQTALIVLMAHIGSFVPAGSASIGLTDRIFTRVGASDNLVRGQSTFMVEMQEAAHILANATPRSLVILDEVGRGTSTYDGVSIAWAILEHLHDTIQAKTLFATHYHELIPLAERLHHCANYSVAVKENREDGVVFLYKILQGGVDKSYGIEVAKLAGLPATAVLRAQQILKDLEEGILDSAIQQEVTDSTRRAPQNQMGIFSDERSHQMLRDHRDTVEELSALDLNQLTPIEALQKLNELKKKIT